MLYSFEKRIIKKEIQSFGTFFNKIRHVGFPVWRNTIRAWKDFLIRDVNKIRQPYQDLLHGEKSALLTRARAHAFSRTEQRCTGHAMLFHSRAVCRHGRAVPKYNTSTPCVRPFSWKLEISWTTSRIEKKLKSLQEHRMSQRKSHYMWEWGRVWKWSRAWRESILALLCRVYTRICCAEA